ncbi:hypothetical protein F5Y17DRAFT_311756 [Xylariaceae sp. FL0594]|nr:hypothetical protein F5Y17DRAFT_311756 [Xylariaceae sp. FL0594]
MRVLPIVNKARKPKFELHLWIYDLNNVPLVAGTSCVKWHLPNSIHGEHRGRTAKCSIDKINHRVTYNYSKTVPIRISIDRSNQLSECLIEFEVWQEFPMQPGSRDEKISLGTVRLNLSEYVEESENFPRRSTVSRLGVSLENARDKLTSHNRKPSAGRAASESDRAGASSQGTVLGTAHHIEDDDVVDEEAEEGIVRRYLMQDSKINSTLKIGILMVQKDGERNFVAPPLKSATVFMGGISGIISSGNEPIDSDDSGKPGSLTNINKSRDASEAQDMYRRALAASWDCQPGELHADECIEDIFAGGSGWRDGTGKKPGRSHSGSPTLNRSSSSGSGSASASSDDISGGTLRPSHLRRPQPHLRGHSSESERSATTVTGRPDHNHHHRSWAHQNSRHHGQNHYQLQGSGHNGRDLMPPFPREDSNTSFSDETPSPSPGIHSRTDSFTSLAPTLGSIGSSAERGAGGLKQNGFRRLREIDEYELRDDLVAWKLPETVT